MLFSFFLLLLDGINWIDVCPNNENLLATASGEKSLKIFDKRQSKVVQTLEIIHTCKIL